jgi:hypothetical protein
MFNLFTKDELAIDDANKIVNGLLSLAKKRLEAESVRVQKIAAALKMHESRYRRLVLAEIFAGVFQDLMPDLYIPGNLRRNTAEKIEKLGQNVETLVETIMKRDERTFVQPW